MQRIVKKFGGSSLASIEHIQAAAELIALDYPYYQLVVVVSAMRGETDRLLQLAETMEEGCVAREQEVLLASAEQVSASLMAMALQRLGIPAISLLGWQIPMVTDAEFGCATIKDVGLHAIENYLQKGQVVVIAGFQGVTDHDEITTLARGGSDLTAVVLAEVLQAKECQILTDVDGVYDADPHLVKDACKLPEIDYATMHLFSMQGAKVLQDRAVYHAAQGSVPIRILSSFQSGTGTLIGTKKPIDLPVALLAAEKKLLWCVTHALTESQYQLCCLFIEQHCQPWQKWLAGQASPTSLCFLMSSKVFILWCRYCLQHQLPRLHQSVEVNKLSIIFCYEWSKQEWKDIIRLSLQKVDIKSYMQLKKTKTIEMIVDNKKSGLLMTELYQQILGKRAIFYQSLFWHPSINKKRIEAQSC